MRKLTVICLLGMCAFASAQQPWNATEFPIGCWRGPSTTHNTVADYQTVKDCNFNIVGPTGGYDVEGNQKVLELCEQVGLRAILVDGRISPQMTQRDDWRDLVGQIVADYGSSAGLYGYYLRDEPNYLQFAPLGEMSREFEKRDPAHLPYINLFPTYANVKQLGAPTYADHLDKFMRIVTPRVISYDHYALLKDGGIRPDYFENMELVRDESLRTGIPWWYVHNSGAYSGYRVPTEAEMRWQVYTSLAYGTKGISYWYYWGRQQEGDDRTGVVDRDGKPTWLYTILQKVNAETRMLGNVLLPLTSTGVFHVGDIPAGTQRLGTDAIIQLPEDQPLMVGLFRADDGTQYAMIVNRDYANPVEFEASFLPHVVGVQRISALDGSLEDLALVEHAVTMFLPAGDGALLRLTTSFDYPKPPETLANVDFQFNTDGDLEGWGNFSGLSGAMVNDGVLTMTLGARDPHFSRLYLRLAPDTYKSLRVRMSVSSGDAKAQVFWITSDEPAFADTRYMDFPIVPDGEWHEYEIPVGEHERWAGQEIRGLRLDPSTGGAEPGATVQIDWIVGVPPAP